MKLSISAVVGALVFGAFSTLHAQLTWEQTQIELHPKPGDAEAVAQFKYENKGSKPIQIKSMKSSCGCTVASLKKNDVAPGEKGEVTATFKIGGRTGVQQKTVTVETDETTNPVTSLVLKAVVAQPIDIQPSFVYWETGEAPKPKKINVKVSKGTAVTKVDVTSNNPLFTAKVEKASGEGDFTIIVVPTDTSKIADATLTIKPDYPQMFYATVRVTEAAKAAAR